jgi:hypothetical protein
MNEEIRFLLTSNERKWIFNSLSLEVKCRKKEICEGNLELSVC